jgi:hypothetical protein
MEYRTVRPAENGFATEADQESAKHDQLQYMMSSSGPDDLLDQLLVVANICEARALFLKEHPKLGPWYNLMGVLLRNALEMTTEPHGPRADASLENPSLYFTDTEHLN